MIDIAMEVHSLFRLQCKKAVTKKKSYTRHVHKLIYSFIIRYSSFLQQPHERKEFQDLLFNNVSADNLTIKSGMIIPVRTVKGAVDILGIKGLSVFFRNFIFSLFLLVYDPALKS